MQNIEEYKKTYKDMVAKYKDIVEDTCSSIQYISLFNHGQKDYPSI